VVETYERINPNFNSGLARFSGKDIIFSPKLAFPYFCIEETISLVFAVFVKSTLEFRLKIKFWELLLHFLYDRPFQQDETALDIIGLEKLILDDGLCFVVQCEAIGKPCLDTPYRIYSGNHFPIFQQHLCYGDARPAKIRVDAEHMGAIGFHERLDKAVALRNEKRACGGYAYLEENTVFP